MLSGRKNDFPVMVSQLLQWFWQGFVRVGEGWDMSWDSWQWHYSFRLSSVFAWYCSRVLSSSMGHLIPGVPVTVECGVWGITITITITIMLWQC
jgi:hypothetical protein